MNYSRDWRVIPKIEVKLQWSQVPRGASKTLEREQLKNRMAVISHKLTSGLEDLLTNCLEDGMNIYEFVSMLEASCPTVVGKSRKQRNEELRLELEDSDGR